MKLIWRLTLAVGTAVILFSIKVMHRGRPAPYFTSPSTEQYAQRGGIHRHGWLKTWGIVGEHGPEYLVPLDRKPRSLGEYFNGGRS